jgi:hypothetical protein
MTSASESSSRPRAECVCRHRANAPVEDVEDEGSRRQRSRNEEVADRLALQIPHRAEDAAYAAGGVRQREEVGEMELANHREMRGGVVIALLE